MVAAGGRSGSGATHPLKIIANIFISFIGAGVLGLPYAFKEAGLAEGILIMVTVGYVSIQAMFLIIDCKYLLLRKRSPGNGAVKSYLKSNVAVKEGSVELKLPLLNDHDADDDDDDKIVIDTSHEITYGDLGFYAFGTKGRWLVDGTVVVSQIGFCCAYLIFISENLSTYISGVTTAQWLVIFLPLLYLLCLLRKLEKLAIFSVFAQVSTIMAFAVVFWFDFEHYHVMKRFHPREFSVKGFPFFFAIAIYCYEGAGMILSLENSLAEHVRPKFKLYFSRTMLCVTGLYVVFGCSGYISFGPETEDIITLNLPPSDGVIDFAMIVKCCLCFSLFFTYPLMIFPVVTIIEKRFPAISSSVARGNGLRLLLVAISGLVVVLIPDFANLMAIIGGTCCTLLAFILPGLFHLKLRRRSLTPREKYFDIFLICLGLLGAVIATSDAISRMSKEVEVPVLPVEGLTPMHQSHTSISWHVATPAINDTLSSNGTLPSSTALPSNGTLPSNATVLSNLSLGGGPVPVNGSLLDRTVSTSVLPAASGAVQSTAGPLLEPANGTVLPAVS